MPDINVIIEKLDEARRGLNEARNIAEEWRRGRVAGGNKYSQKASHRTDD